ncbi:unnamed protein product, partial [Protopolystoma xenopodis]
RFSTAQVVATTYSTQSFVGSSSFFGSSTPSLTDGPVNVDPPENISRLDSTGCEPVWSLKIPTKTTALTQFTDSVNSTARPCLSAMFNPSQLSRIPLASICPLMCSRPIQLESDKSNDDEEEEDSDDGEDIVETETICTSGEDHSDVEINEHVRSISGNHQAAQKNNISQKTEELRERRAAQLSLGLLDSSSSTKNIFSSVDMKISSCREKICSMAERRSAASNQAFEVEYALAHQFSANLFKRLSDTEDVLNKNYASTSLPSSSI